LTPAARIIPRTAVRFRQKPAKRAKKESRAEAESGAAAR
jgi:hypothetical protein